MDYGASSRVLRLPPRWFGLYPAVSIAGGPFRDCPLGVFGVRLTEQQPLEWRGPEASLWLPIPDFSVPQMPAAAVGEAVVSALQASFSGPVYVGCMGGWGRTGLFLALLAKAWGMSSPVAYVRREYGRAAVETAEQERYVAEFDAARLKRQVFRMVVRRRLSRLFGR